jgi:hypothetical protein
MNIFRSKSLALATAGLGAALSLTTTIGQAQEAPYGFSDLVAFTGTATITSGNNDGIPSGCGTFVCLVGGSGHYTFTSNLCVGVSDTDVSAACTVSASGPFQNIVCGTGGAQGTATVTEPPAPDEPNGETDNVTFGIIFVGGVGVVTGNAGLSQGDNTAPLPPPFEDFIGVVTLTPGPQGDPTLNQCVSGFGIDSVDVVLDLPVALIPLPPI